MNFFKKLVLLISCVSYGCFSSAAVAQIDNYEAAVQAYYEQDIDTALIHLKNALKENNNNLPAKLLLAEVLIKKHSYAAAEHELNEALLDGADYNLIIEPLGRALLLQGSYEAILQLAENKQLHKQSIISIQLLKAKAYSGLLQPNDAKGIYLEILSENPNHSEAMVELASIYIRQNNIKQSEVLLEQAEGITDKNSRFWHVRGLLASKLRQLQNAETYLTAANKLDSNNTAILSSITANYISLKQFEKASEIVEEILTLQPKHLQAQLMKGRILKALNKDKLANEVLIKLTSQISAIDESYKLSQPHILFIDAMSSYRQEDWFQAKIKLRIYINQLVDDKDINAVVLLSDVYLQLQQADEALKLLSSYESELIKNEEYALMLAELYLQFNKIFKAEYVLDQLPPKFKKNEAVIILSAKTLSAKGLEKEALATLESTDFQNSSQYQHMLAIIAFRLGDINKSLQYVQALLALSPETIEYQLLYTRVLAAHGKFSDAEKVIVDLYQKHPNNREVRFSYAFMHFNLNNYERAKKILNELVSEDVDDGESWFVLAQIAYDSGKIEETITILERQTKNKNEFSRHKALEKLSGIYYGQQQFNKSISVTNVLLQKNRLNPQALFMKAKNLIALKQVKEAKYQLNILFGLWSDEPRNLLKLSQLQRQVNDFEAAEKSLDMAYTVAPRALPVIIDIIKLKIKLNKLDQASVILTKAEKVEYKNNVYLIILKGDIEAGKNNIEIAFNYYLTALKKDDANIIALMKLAQISQTDTLSDKFIQRLDYLVEKYPNRAVQRHVLADHLFARQDFQQAKFQYQKLIMTDLPSSKLAWVLNNLANIYLLENAYPQAVEVSKQAYEILPTPVIVDTFGWSLVLSGDIKQGLSYLRQSYSMSSLNPAIKYHIAYALVKLNRRAEAKVLLQSIVKLADTFVEHNAAKELLLSL